MENLTNQESELRNLLNHHRTRAQILTTLGITATHFYVLRSRLKAKGALPSRAQKLVRPSPRAEQIQAMRKEGKSYAEISLALGIGEQSARNCFSLAKRKKAKLGMEIERILDSL